MRFACACLLSDLILLFFFLIAGIKICITKKTGQKEEKGEESCFFTPTAVQKGLFWFCNLLQHSPDFIYMLLLLCFCCTHSLPTFFGLIGGKGMFLLHTVRHYGKCDNSQSRPLPVGKNDSINSIFYPFFDEVTL